MDRFDIKEQTQSLKVNLSPWTRPSERPSERPSRVDDSELREVFSDLESEEEAPCSMPLHYDVRMKADEDDHDHILAEPASYTQPRYENRSSVSFHSHVILEDGVQRPMHEPLPGRKIRLQGRSLLEQPSNSDSAPSRGESTEYEQNLIAGELCKRRHLHHQESQHDSGNSHMPSPENAEDEYWKGQNMTKPACSLSELAISPEYRSPEMDQHPDYYTTSPRTPSSPIPFPHLPGSESSTDLQGSYLPWFRSVNGDRINNSRRTSRRSTGQSTSSLSMSPASAFLSSFSHINDYVSVKPDDEGREIGDDRKYILGRQIGAGGFSVIKEAHTIEASKRITYAVKIMRKQLAKNTDHQNDVMEMRIEHEVSMWQELQHPYIMRLVDLYDSPFAKFCVMTLVNGNLHDLVRSHRRGSSSTSTKSATSIRSPTHNSTSNTDMGTKMSSPQKPNTKIIPLHLAKRYLYQIASALYYLHRDMRMVHRDIKLENCLLDTSSSSQGNILLCDFGMANFITRGDRADRDYGGTEDVNEENPVMQGEAWKQKHDHTAVHSTFVTGSLPYASPELLKGNSENLYEPSSDVWAFGVVCYALFTGELPFTSVLMPLLMKSILQGDWDQNRLRDAIGGETEDVEGAVNLVMGCLRIDQEQRYTIGDVLSCSFLENVRMSCDDEAARSQS